ncbi:MAG: hypothetical protein AAF202_03950, partial [Pseudomonadota bacterium]
ALAKLGIENDVSLHGRTEDRIRAAVSAYLRGASLYTSGLPLYLVDLLSVTEPIEVKIDGLSKDESEALGKELLEKSRRLMGKENRWHIESGAADSPVVSEEELRTREIFSAPDIAAYLSEQQRDQDHLRRQEQQQQRPSQAQSQAKLESEYQPEEAHPPGLEPYGFLYWQALVLGRGVKSLDKANGYLPKQGVTSVRQLPPGAILHGSQDMGGSFLTFYHDQASLQSLMLKIVAELTLEQTSDDKARLRLAHRFLSDFMEVEDSLFKPIGTSLTAADCYFDCRTDALFSRELLELMDLRTDLVSNQDHTMVLTPWESFEIEVMPAAKEVLFKDRKLREAAKKYPVYEMMVQLPIDPWRPWFTQQSFEQDLKVLVNTVPESDRTRDEILRFVAFLSDHFAESPRTGEYVDTLKGAFEIRAAELNQWRESQNSKDTDKKDEERYGNPNLKDKSADQCKEELSKEKGKD